MQIETIVDDVVEKITKERALMNAGHSNDDVLIDAVYAMYQKELYKWTKHHMAVNRDFYIDLVRNPEGQSMAIEDNKWFRNEVHDLRLRAQKESDRLPTLPDFMNDQFKHGYAEAMYVIASILRMPEICCESMDKARRQGHIRFNDDVAHLGDNLRIFNCPFCGVELYDNV